MEGLNVLKEELNSYKVYDLEERTFIFSNNIRLFIKKLSKNIGNIEDSKQLIRSSGSIGANYIEANDSVSQKDFIFRIKLCRKEAKESRYWLRLLDSGENSLIEQERDGLIQEAKELVLIFASILKKSESKI
jgi:four helix bundle protein